MFGCQDCGDCSLPDIAYVCPESHVREEPAQRPLRRHARRPVRGRRQDCIWALAYERLKAYGEEESMLDGPTVIKDNALAGTSAWANAFLGRDHNGGRNHQ